METGPSPAQTGSASRSWPWILLAAAEVAVVAAVVLADLWIPTFVILGLAVVSLVARRKGPSSLGLRRVAGGWRLAGAMLAFAVGWTLLQVGLIMPIVNRVTGQTQDLSDFAKLEGNLGMLAGLLVLSWTLAAFGEEFAYRGYLQTRLTQVLGERGAGLVVSVALSSLLFGFAHTEQGAVGVILTTIDAAVFCALRYRYDTLWASVLAHGFNNTIGFVTFYLIGPVYGLW